CVLLDPPTTVSYALSLHDALPIYREMLLEKRRHIDRLLETIDKTIQHLEGETDMTAEEKFEAFKEKLIEDNERRFGAEIREKYRSEEHTSELQSRENLVCRLLLEK